MFSPSVLARVVRRLGLFADQGLDIVEQPVASSSAQFRALLDGDLDMALTSPDNVLAYRSAPDNPLGETADLRTDLDAMRTVVQLRRKYTSPPIGGPDPLASALDPLDKLIDPRMTEAA
ncbi:hypothetical protein SAMN05421505_10345 [Sinosporangium album]|uniref:Uncharacterized protein n=1 Tax=Sinosporangium album TaxID=504805 RepID=A0A1G7T056_9ACTN|nr:hypothetical protein SAMN05421505_10345 [Sinosporangium album]